MAPGEPSRGLLNISNKLGDNGYKDVILTEYQGSEGNGGYWLGAEVSDDEGRSIVNRNNTIDIEGIWDKQIIIVGFYTSPEVKHAEEIRALGYQAINGIESVQSGHNHTGWHLTFHSISDKASRAPMHLIVDTDQYKMPIDISVLFSNDAPERLDDKYFILAKTALRIASNGTLVSANVTMFESDARYEEGLLMPLLLHELGHSLGLGHSTSDTSIMYPKLMIVNGYPIGEIGTCEIAALNAMYFADNSNITIGCSRENEGN
jgi:matrixin